MPASHPLPLDEQIELAEYLLESHRGHQAKLAQVVPHSLSELAELLFLTSPTTLHFLRQDAPRIATLLRRRTERVRVAQQGGIRGRVDWAATTRAQAEASEAFVCRAATPNFDQPENQYFLFCLHRVLGSIRLFGLDEKPHFVGEKLTPVQQTLTALRTDWEQVQRALPSVGGLTVPKSLTEAHRRSIRLSRQGEYRRLPELLTVHAALITAPEPAAWQAALPALTLRQQHWESYLTRLGQPLPQEP